MAQAPVSRLSLLSSLQICDQHDAACCPAGDEELDPDFEELFNDCAKLPYCASFGSTTGRLMRFEAEC